MPDVKITHTNEVVGSVSLTWPDLRSALVQNAIKALPNGPERDALISAKTENISIDIRQEEEGSPSYRVDRWRACVRIVAQLPPVVRSPPTGFRNSDLEA